MTEYKVTRTYNVELDGDQLAEMQKRKDFVLQNLLDAATRYVDMGDLNGRLFGVETIVVGGTELDWRKDSDTDPDVDDCVGWVDYEAEELDSDYEGM